MNKQMLILLTLTIVPALACMTTITITEPQPNGKSAPTAVPAASLSQEPESGAVYELPQPETKCATVTAIRSLHLRQQPTEKSAVVAYLAAGQKVTVINSRGAWWEITTGAAQGYSNADYLQESECEP